MSNFTVIVNRSRRSGSSGQLGQQAGFHTVEVAITGTSPWGTAVFGGNIGVQIQQKLVDSGWFVQRITDETGFPAISSMKFRLWLTVGDIYSDATVQSNLRRDLAGLFDVSGMTFATQWTVPSAYNPPALVPVGSAVNNPAGVRPPNYTAGTPPVPPTGTGGSGASFLDRTFDFGFGAVSGLVVAGVVGLVLVLKK